MNRIVISFFLLGLLSEASVVVHADTMDMNMPGMDMKSPSATAANDAVGVVKAVDSAKGRVTSSPQPVKSLGWPAMTMDFAVKDKALFAKLVPGKTIHFKFVQENNQSVVTSVK